MGMKPKAGYDYLATAAHFAAESSTGTNVNVCTTDDFTKSVDALVYYIDPENEEMKIAYPNLLFDRNIIDGRGMMCSFLTLAIGNNQGMGDVEYGKIYDIYFPPCYLRLFDGPSCCVIDMWRILGRGTTTSCRQGEEAWKLWKAGAYGDISLSDGIIEYAKTHEEIKGAFLTFQKDADQIYPGWKEKLGYTGESSVQAATFDWQ